ncbi:MAG: amidohydrolase family protein [Bryobacteraceae bacterium]
MRKLLAALGLCCAAFAQTLSIEEYEPKSTLVVPGQPVTRAKFPFIDVHNHQRNMGRDRLDKLVKDMDGINLQILVNLSGGYGDRLKSAVETMKGAYPKRFAVFANIDFNGLDEPGYSERAAAQFEQDVKNGAQGLKIFKNFGMDLKDSKGQRVHVDDSRFDKIFQMCAKYKVPVLIHTGEPAAFFQPHDRFNERWLELKQYPSRARPPERYPSWETLMTEQRNLFARHPGANFINAHLGWLGGNLGELGRQMDKLPNVYTEIGAVLAELGRQPRFAKQWFIKYQDRVLFGKDTWAPDEYHYYFRVLESADEYFDYYRKRHAFWKMYGLDLPDDVLKKLYFKNALRIVPGLDAAPFPK